MSENFEINKTDQQWQEALTPEEFEIARKHGTERAFTGKYWDAKEDGTYACVCCGNELFSSNTKFDSGTGWPSFFEPMNNENVETQEDRSLGALRIEVHCKKCGAHLGHVFPDGPKDKTGLRYCINSASLNLKKNKTP